MHDIYKFIIIILWGIFGSYWLYYSVGNKDDAYKLKSTTRMLVWFSLVVILLFGRLSLPVKNILDIEVLYKSNLSGITGDLICGLGVIISIWSRKIIGTNWSSVVTLKKDHELVQNGPYKYIRHPIYTGMILALIGTAIVLGNLKALIIIIVIVAGLIKKSIDEEKLLTANLAEYSEYKKRTKRLIPFVF